MIRDVIGLLNLTIRAKDDETPPSTPPSTLLTSQFRCDVFFFSRRHAIPVQTYPLRKIGSSSPVPFRLGGTLDCLARFLFLFFFSLFRVCTKPLAGKRAWGGCCYSLLGLRRSVSRERGTDFPVDRKDGPNLWFVHVLHRKMIVPGCTRLCFCFRSFLALLSFLFHGLTVHPFYPQFFFYIFAICQGLFFFLFRLIAIHPFNWLYTLFAISRLCEFV